ncbi:probable LRR receptor-like serine/threonine-protein kinase At3g47570 [Cornus florida]|uniref:probable LRR receptor-like serine/threonine-protein kinase At3g47570 n=1 Tax=Cornus florida TaxID=4283 RepID=UPI002898318E|nr:probable LRR receptor-like serine/threonine-protein kinase At3g47570 [Cornus florida]
MVSLAFLSSNYTDQIALLAFKSAIKSDPKNVLGSNWTEKANFCEWVGVSCSQRRQRVTALNLGGSQLDGTISPHIGNLSFLTELQLSYNHLHGHVVHELSQLRRLTILILDFNNLQGLIPASLHLCEQLRVISMVDNDLTGGIPRELSTLTKLHTLFLGGNNLTGTIPSFLGNMSALLALDMGLNKFYGSIPHEIGNLPILEFLNLGENYLTGSIPPSIFNISSLAQLSLLQNSLSGNLPSNTGRWLPSLQTLFLAVSELGGNIPLHLSNSSQLDILDLGLNKFTGTVPTSLGHLEVLTRLNLQQNQLTLELSTSQELSFLTSLTSLRYLEQLYINENLFHGILPDSIGNFSSSLQIFSAFNCQIIGPIPERIGSLRTLTLLDLEDNNLNGTIPSTIEGLKGLQRLYLDGNKIEGSIPNGICSLGNLGEIYLENNKFSGSIPGCIGDVTRLQRLILGSNALNSSIPISLWSLNNLLFLNLSFNSLSGSLGPNMRAPKSLESIDLSSNQISGIIPSSLGTFQSLTSLNLSRNLFWGSIPESFGNLITLDSSDLSVNNLSGPIPKSLEALSHLKFLNLSYNKLSGEIPSGGPIANFTVQSFMKNKALCVKSVLKGIPQKNAQTQNSVIDATEHRLISYHELCCATNDFCEASLIGIGGFGSVYKGTLSDGTNIAVKILNLQLEGAFRSFEAECSVLRTVRHRNLVKVISTCSNPELRALVLEYMPNGSLEKWLYSHNYCLNLLQRVSIMHDVALALEYLHQSQSVPVVHCDLKPSNVLLDEDMVAHVGDFGIAKFLMENKIETQTKTLGTIGYIAPEYGSEGRVSTKGDIYSYGIMLLETFIRKKPTNEMFTGELSLREWVKASLSSNIMEIVDGNLLTAGDQEIIALEGIFTVIMKLGLECCKELPEERSDTKELANKLNKIKLQLLSNPCH